MKGIYPKKESVPCLERDGILLDALDAEDVGETCLVVVRGVVLCGARLSSALLVAVVVND